MGPVYGNDTQIANQMSGFVTNPMEHAEASKIAIYSVASYAWNPTNITVKNLERRYYEHFARCCH